MLELIGGLGQQLLGQVEPETKFQTLDVTVKSTDIVLVVPSPESVEVKLIPASRRKQTRSQRALELHEVAC